MDRRGEVVVKDDAKEISEGGEVGMEELVGVCVFVCVEGKSAPNVNGVSKRARSSAFAHLAESGEDVLRSE